MPPISRRSFLRSSETVVTAAVLSRVASVGGDRRSANYRAVVVGHTGAGDYGHGYDRIFNDQANVSVVAVADPDPDGRARAAVRCGATRTYADYREMFRRERPDLVSVAMRLPRQHLAIAESAFAAGANVFMEKPMTATLPEADRLERSAIARQLKVAVAHTRRCHPGFLRVKTLINDDFLGEIRQVRMQGKQDSRVGGEDMIVLGTHDFDLLRFYFGDPRWCEASVMVDGKDAKPSDARRGREPMRVAGDTIHAQFGFSGGLVATWSSVKTRDDWNTRALGRERWAFEILGSKRIVAWQSGIEFAYLDSPFMLQRGRDTAWRPLPVPDTGSGLAATRTIHAGRDLIQAVEQGRDPRCSATDGRWTIEMLTAVYQSHFAGRRVSFPLMDRSDPLAPA